MRKIIPRGPQLSHKSISEVTSSVLSFFAPGALAFFPAGEGERGRRRSLSFCVLPLFCKGISCRMIWLPRFDKPTLLPAPNPSSTGLLNRNSFRPRKHQHHPGGCSVTKYDQCDVSLKIYLNRYHSCTNRCGSLPGLSRSTPTGSRQCFI